MSKVVFVGNVPYNMGEEQLIEVFRSVGQVIGFSRDAICIRRLVFDRETGKPRGYGFCEFADHETAASAVRNLNNTDVGGRPLRIDLADSDPFLEGKTTVHGELIDGGETRAQWREREKRERNDDDYPSPPPRNDPGHFLKSLPRGVPLAPGTTALDAISNQLGTMNPGQLTEVLAQTKAFVINHPEQARILLVAHPQLAHALFQALFMNKIVDPAILQRMLAATHANGATNGIPPQVPPQAVPPSLVPPMMGQAPTIPLPYPPFSQHIQQPPIGPPPPYYQQPSSQQSQPMAAVPPVPTPVAAAPVIPQPNFPPNIDQASRDMLMQVLALTPEQIDKLPQHEKDAIVELKRQFAGVFNPTN
ncbi:hypothetical protein DFH11DRAFT_682195 [Phellopilus nigrolimitatus]|nr:hypothetical protein DFH11DRAFT_682195 [Phellopilus nigrolimitatus]